jgi:hypothetical protein
LMNFSCSSPNRLKPVCTPEIAGPIQKNNSRKFLNRLKPALRPAKAGHHLVNASIHLPRDHLAPQSPVGIDAPPTTCDASLGPHATCLRARPAPSTISARLQLGRRPPPLKRPRRCSVHAPPLLSRTCSRWPLAHPPHSTSHAPLLPSRPRPALELLPKLVPP